MFHIAAFLVAVLATASSPLVLAQTSGTTTLAFDFNYDNASLSLNSVACSGGPNGLWFKNSNYTTLSSLPSFPKLGASFTVSEWDSPGCGACFAVTYGNRTVNILAVDKCSTGFTVSHGAMDTLTDGRATSLGRVDVSYVQVNASACNM